MSGGGGRDKTGLAAGGVFVASLTRTQRTRRSETGNREASKHVDSDGVGFWTRVRLSAPPFQSFTANDRKAVVIWNHELAVSRRLVILFFGDGRFIGAACMRVPAGA